MAKTNASKAVVDRVIADMKIGAKKAAAVVEDVGGDVVEAVATAESEAKWTTDATKVELVYDKKEFKKVKGYVGVRERRPDGVFVNLVCPNGALHCIRVDEGDAVIIVRNNGDFVDMVVKNATDKALALQAAAKKFLRLIERSVKA
jgi:hypothetical protein